jgi:hypothetical protein
LCCLGCRRSLREGDAHGTSAELKARLALRKAQREDPELSPIIDWLEKGTCPQGKSQTAWEKDHDAFTLDDDGILVNVWEDKRSSHRRHVRFAIPQPMQAQFLAEAHSDPESGHMGRDHTYERLRRLYWWAGMQADVGRICQVCAECNRRNSPPGSKQGPLQPLPVPEGPWESVEFDFTHLPLADGYKGLAVAVDRHSKWVEIEAIRDETAETMADFLFRRIVLAHGAPREFISDCARAFRGKTMEVLTALAQARHA